MNRTTIILDRVLRKRLVSQAHRDKTTMTDLIQSFVRVGLTQRKNKKSRKKTKIPSFNMGASKVDISDRNALYDYLDENE